MKMRTYDLRFMMWSWQCATSGPGYCVLHCRRSHAGTQTSQTSVTKWNTQYWSSREEKSNSLRYLEISSLCNIQQMLNTYCIHIYRAMLLKHNFFYWYQKIFLKKCILLFTHNFIFLTKVASIAFSAVVLVCSENKDEPRTKVKAQLSKNNCWEIWIYCCLVSSVRLGKENFSSWYFIRAQKLAILTS